MMMLEGIHRIFECENANDGVQTRFIPTDALQAPPRRLPWALRKHGVFRFSAFSTAVRAGRTLEFLSMCAVQ